MSHQNILENLPPHVARQYQRYLAAQQGLQQQQEPQKIDLTQHNPLSGDLNDLRLLRATTDCPIPDGAKFFQQMGPKLAEMEGDLEEMLDTLGIGMATVMGANNYCKSHIKTRTAVKIIEDENLKDEHAAIHERLTKLEELMKEADALRSELKGMMAARWEKLVKEYGLNPEECLYYIDEDEGIVEQLFLDCTTCKGGTRIRKMKQKLTDMLMYHKEPKNDRTGTGITPEGDAEAHGEESAPEQEVSGVADPAASDDSNGDNSAGETA